MFRSYEYLGYSCKTNEFEFKITDSDFVVVASTFPGSSVNVNMVVAKEYARRNLQVGKNIALLCLYLRERVMEMKDITYWQDKYCPEYIDNWTEIAAERDQLLDKLSAMI